MKSSVMKVLHVASTELDALYDDGDASPVEELAEIGSVSGHTIVGLVQPVRCLKKSLEAGPIQDLVMWDPETQSFVCRNWRLLPDRQADLAARAAMLLNTDLDVLSVLHPIASGIYQPVKAASPARLELLHFSHGVFLCAERPSQAVAALERISERRVDGTMTPQLFRFCTERWPSAHARLAAARDLARASRMITDIYRFDDPGTSRPETKSLFEIRLT